MRALAALVSSLYLSSTTVFTTVQPHLGALLVSGYEQQGSLCVWLTIDEATLRTKSSRRRSCSTAPVALSPTINYVGRSQNAVVRVAGRVVMRFDDVSDTKPEWTVGGGSLWLYDVATTEGPEVVRLSVTTGRVEERVRMPGMYRPLLAADADGLWLAPATNGGVSTPGAAPLYHVRPGAGHAVLVHRGGRAALWITAHAHSVWFESISGTKDVSVWRVDDGRARLLVRRKPPFETGATYADGSLWAMAWSHQCMRVLVLKIDPRTGRRSTLVSMPSLDQCGGVFYDSNTPMAFTHGALFFLNGPKLYRVRP
jgi:hypothetical protein